ncbi:uncharacterized protein LOC135493929 [Lineus longissimus]|uniref:uncharacterized protein LOC135493929 n=1 Tax=Lineus longissimus TaxID=88925 RepID=UPI002B4E9037
MILNLVKMRRHSFHAHKTAVPMTTNKDTVHIMKSSGIIHVIGHVITKWVNKEEAGNIPPTISIHTIRASQLLYGTLAQQKHTFMQALFRVGRSDTTHLWTSKTLREKIMRTICRRPGPLTTTTTEVQKCVHGSQIVHLKDEIDKMSKDGVFTYMTTEDRWKTTVIFKPWPGSLTDKSTIISQGGVTIDAYTGAFNDTVKMTPRLSGICMEHHPHADMLDTILDTPTQSSQDAQSSGATMQPSAGPSTSGAATASASDTD